MKDENAPMTGAEIMRWSVLAALLIGCIALYFRFAPTTPPVIHPAVADTTQ
jgi:hypothetical protein